MPSAPHLLSFLKDAACSLEFHHPCTCIFILLLISMPLSPVGALAVSYCSKKALTRASLASTRFLYSYDGAPRGRDSQRPQISVKKCCDMLSILSLVTDSRAVELSPRLPDLAPAVNHFFISGSTEDHTHSEQ